MAKVETIGAKRQVSDWLQSFLISSELQHYQDVGRMVDMWNIFWTHNDRILNYDLYRFDSFFVVWCERTSGICDNTLLTKVAKTCFWNSLIVILSSNLYIGSGKCMVHWSRCSGVGRSDRTLARPCRVSAVARPWATALGTGEVQLMGGKLTRLRLWPFDLDLSSCYLHFRENVVLHWRAFALYATDVFCFCWDVMNHKDCYVGLLWVLIHTFFEFALKRQDVHTGFA